MRNLTSKEENHVHKIIEYGESDIQMRQFNSRVWTIQFSKQNDVCESVG